MNYRHRYHAGNVADVFKHAVLVGVLGALDAKDTAFCVIETHAGGGLYRLEPPGEFQQGIGRLWPVRDDWPAFRPYFALLGRYNGESLRAYPGSPLLIADRLRPQDRAVFVERQPEEHAALTDNLRGRRAIALHQADGLTMLKALLPPRENRGLVLIDPPYEQPDEFRKVSDALRQAVERWRNGIYMLWYPVKQRAPIDRLHAELRDLTVPCRAVELMTLPEDVAQRLNGSGVVLVNPPWRMLEQLNEPLRALAAFLAPPGGRPQLRILDLAVPEKK